MKEQRECCRVNAYLIVKAYDPIINNKASSFPSSEIFKPSEGQYAAEMAASSIIRVDLSEKGVSFTGKTLYKIKEDLEVTLIFPHQKKHWCAVTVCSRVIWVSSVRDGGYKTGLEFVGMASSAKREIRAFILASERQANKVNEFEETHYKDFLGRVSLMATQTAVMDTNAKPTEASLSDMVLREPMHKTIEAEIYHLIYEHPAISAKCVCLPPEFFTMTYNERLSGYIDVIEEVQTETLSKSAVGVIHEAHIIEELQVISKFIDTLRMRLMFANKDRRKRNDPDYFKNA